ncbi:type I-C CRISPR-associated protein Cas5c [Rhodopseudomonas palustris]|uniref:type I-C CRISPR-associated protein Cas5c n=1 Tax=Rhodopseudomonas palustris TaxID=1076 RepID=UPI0020CF0222|nr:type I-C CRISPR-associated protein Cas5c [Rhodopseudomonas palustris]MCP9626293.1 type I-C CRISPR-associated protein Cas5c [Rhodopseudomonas palustris]
MAYGVRLRVKGRWALFTRPEMKVERVSYDVMTPSAARGILEAIHWKPAIRWIIDEIHVLKPIRFQSIRRNEVGAKAPVATIRRAMKSEEIGDLALVIEDHRQQRAATLLSNVDYVICAHFAMTTKAGIDDNEAKHLDTFNRRARKGQAFHQPCLGTREFPASFELLEPHTPLPQPDPEDRTAGLGFGIPRDLGFMLYDIDHDGDGGSVLFRATLDRGVVKVPPPDSPELRR